MADISMLSFSAHTQDWQDGSASKGSCCQVQWPEFDSRTHMVKREEQFRDSNQIVVQSLHMYFAVCVCVCVQDT